jgi:hypothetical protein
MREGVDRDAATVRTRVEAMQRERHDSAFN